MRVYTRITYDQIYSATQKEEPPPPGGQVSGWTCGTCVQNCRVYLVKTGWTFGLLCGKHVYFTYIVSCTYLVLV